MLTSNVTLFGGLRIVITPRQALLCTDALTQLDEATQQSAAKKSEKAADVQKMQERDKQGEIVRFAAATDKTTESYDRSTTSCSHLFLETLP